MPLLTKLAAVRETADFGYWYNQGLLYPDLLSAMVALEPASQANGCLELLSGSHTMGRIDHDLIGEQQGATAARVEAAKARHPLVHAEMESGDVVFFHALTLHASKPNLSDTSRWALTCCYNTRANDPIEESFHPNYRSQLPVHSACRVSNLNLYNYVDTDLTARGCVACGSPLAKTDDAAVLACGATAEWTEGSDLLGADVNKAQAEWGS
eukprot:SAG31_NODE_1289_length_8983_cov_9.783543_10_plen_211_part_00